MRRLLIASSLLTLSLPLHAAETCITLDTKSVAALFDDLNFAMSSLDSRQVAQRYWPDAVLLPTASNTPRTDSAAITDYYAHFLTKRPRGHIDTRTIQSRCNMAVDTGTYTFSLMDDKGTTTNESARYTFIYQYRDGAWKILNQQSSALVDASVSAAAEAQIVAAAIAAAPAKVDAAKPATRKERRPKRKDYLDDPIPVAAKKVEKPAATPVAETKPSTEVKAAAEEKPAAEAKLATDAKPVADQKSATDAKAPHDAKATPSAKTTPVAAATPAAKSSTDPAPPADAKLPPEVRTALFANLTSSPPPSNFYPRESMRKKERGTVNLKVCVSGEGVVSDSIEVVKTSGSKYLDEAAMTWARAATWVPATYNRQRVEGCSKVDVGFEPVMALANAHP